MKTKILHRISTIFAILLVLPLAVISVIASVSAAIENSENDITNDIEQHQPSEEGGCQEDGFSAHFPSFICYVLVGGWSQP